MPLRWNLLSAAKARNMTIDQYTKGGWTRWVHIHEEIAFDRLSAIMEEVRATDINRRSDKTPVKR